MLRVLVVIGIVIAIVLVMAAVVKTLVWLALIALIFAAVCLAFGLLRLGRHSAHRSRNRF